MNDQDLSKQGANSSQMIQVSQAWQQDNKDEIDLLDLLATIWRGRVKIVSFALVFAVLAAVYALTATKWYESEFKINAVESYELTGVNNSELVNISTQEALNQLKAKLFSPEHFFNYYQNKEVQAAFSNKPEGVSAQQYAYQFFANNIKTLEPKAIKNAAATESPSVGLRLTFPEGVKGDELLLGYLYWTSQQIKSEIIELFDFKKNNELVLNTKKMDKILSEYKVATDNKIQQLEETDRFKLKKLNDQLSALKTKLIKENKKYIQILDENISIANALKIQNPTTPSDFRKNQKVEGEVFRAEFSSMDKQPLYYRGYESLMAEKAELIKRTKNNYPSNEIVELERQIEMLKENREIEKLLNRKNPAAFLDDYEALQKRNAYLNTLIIDVKSANLYHLDVFPLPPVAPIKPKKLLIVALSIILGGFVGVMYVLLSGSVKVRRKERKEQMSLNLGE